MAYKVHLSVWKEDRIRIQTNSGEYMEDMKDAFAVHVQNYFWIPQYKSGQWDGKVNFISANGTFPYGLLLDFMKLHKIKHRALKLTADKEVKEIFRGHSIDVNFDLSLFPRPYQKESVELMLKYSKGIIRSATASGKSLVISYIIKNLLDNKNITNVMRSLIIVPSITLIEQFKGDMIEYGIDDRFIGRVYSEAKEWDRAIVISTWQTLMKNHDKLSMYDCIIGDECHQVKAHELKKIMSKSKARYKMGFTGTLPTHPADLMNTKSFLGPILKEYPSGLLADQGFIAKCNVRAINISYPFGIDAETYNEVKEEVFYDKYRINIIQQLCHLLVDENILLLVSYIKEGKELEHYIKNYTTKEVVFLSGKDKAGIREEWRHRMINEKNIVIIATYGIFQQGINIPNLKHGVLASPTKSKIRTLQSVGRTLRTHEDKEDGAYIYDIIDDVKFLGRHGKKRLEYYESEGFDIKVHNIDKGDIVHWNEILPTKHHQQNP